MFFAVAGWPWEASKVSGNQPIQPGGTVSTLKKTKQTDKNCSWDVDRNLFSTGAGVCSLQHAWRWPREQGQISHIHLWKCSRELKWCTPIAHGSFREFTRNFRWILKMEVYTPEKYIMEPENTPLGKMKQTYIRRLFQHTFGTYQPAIMGFLS